MLFNHLICSFYVIYGIFQTILLVYLILCLRWCLQFFNEDANQLKGIFIVIIILAPQLISEFWPSQGILSIYHVQIRNWWMVA